jgi:hypothetical protein
MEMPGADTPPVTYVQRSAYTLARVGADPKTAHLTNGLETPHVALTALLRNLEDLEFEEQKKTAVYDTRDEHCDDEIEGFELSLLAHVRKNRNDDRYVRYFPDGLREITAAPRKEGPDRIQQLLDTLALDANHADLGPLVAIWAPKIGAAHAELRAAEESLSTTEKAMALLKEKSIPAAMAEWRVEYKKLEGALTSVYASNPKKVDRFFKPFRKRRKNDKSAESASAASSAG